MKKLPPMTPELFERFAWKEGTEMNEEQLAFDVWQREQFAAGLRGEHLSAACYVQSLLDHSLGIQHNPHSYVLAEDGTVTPLAPANGTDFKLEELYKAIGDGCQCITIHQLGDGKIIVVDDDGYSSGKETNTAASLLAGAVFQGQRGIVGNVVICPDSMVK